MKLDLAQMVALTSYGNAYLTNQSISLDLNHSTTNSCKKIDFIELISNGKTSEEIPLASKPNEWFEYLRTNDVINLKLHFPPTGGDRISASMIGGGGKWIIEAFKGSLSDVWEGRWNFNPSGDETRIWSVTYGLTSKNYNLPLIEYPPLEYWHKELIVGITKLKKFAIKQSLDQFIDIFQNALDCIASDDPLSLIIHNDLVPAEKYERKAKQIFAACTKAWIVAMVNWNDLSFKGKIQKEYTKLSNNLYLKICRAIMVATNSILT
ncbi:hypothetical protein LCGC14_1311900 [marine sediment metagenome]|uniref:Uncharacterized protein n=1 Tax=marine sediment metagenome TaxID=412755 RepID=A0A0F9NPI7_9ZZZZ